MSTAFLLVTCCKDPSRAEILNQVVENMKEKAPQLQYSVTVFDNASTEPGIADVLKGTFKHVYQSDQNVGYWSAIHWWLTEGLKELPPRYTYIVESDMMHYDFPKIWEAASYLERHPDVGSVRLHEYSVANRHLYNKDAPRPDSRSNLWQSHTNRLTGRPVEFVQREGSVWETTFLTQLPALNRYETMLDVFNELATVPAFTEPDFQRLYWQRYQKTGIVDGGIFNCDLNPYGSKGITGSWSSPEQLAKVGYHATRTASITPVDGYTVTKLV